MTNAGGAVVMSSASLQYISVPVNAVKAGAPYNPTSDAVQFAFLLDISGTPGSSDWVSGSWVTLPNYLYPWACQCLIGPGGTITLSPALYVVWVKITDNPEIPVLIAGMLRVL